MSENKNTNLNLNRSMNFNLNVNEHQERKELEIVRDHYNSLPHLSQQERKNSSIIRGIRSFNNWIKSVLIHIAIEEVNLQKKKKNSKSSYICVGDFACGVGGDLGKYKRIPSIVEYVGIDCADESLKEAQSRHETDQQKQRNKSNKNNILVEWKQCDLRKEELQLPQIFDLISCQFALHYGCGAYKHVYSWLENINYHMKIGSVCIATWFNANRILSLFKTNTTSSAQSNRNTVFSNSLWKFEFETDQNLIKSENAFDKKQNNNNYSYRNETEQKEKEQDELYNAFGHRYLFSLKEAVDSCPEYLVPTEFIVKIAKEKFGLCLQQEWKSLEDIFTQYQNQPILQQRLIDMNVINSQGKLQMSLEEWQLVQLYSAFLFVKQ